MDVRRSARIPAGIDGGEAHLSVGVGELRAAQEGLPARRAGFLACIAGIDAETIGVPDIDAGALKPRTILGLDDLQCELQGSAGLSLGDVGAHELRIEIERPFDRLRR